ncbi:hypothetical protein BVI2075_900003 [Burkholderia vietnamiensis]|nr:hypothetical protein BVI2075_900003 [Burkholderia vietnamiensis]
MLSGNEFVRAARAAEPRCMGAPQQYSALREKISQFENFVARGRRRSLQSVQLARSRPRRVVCTRAILTFQDPGDENVRCTERSDEIRRRRA